ncbi:ABC transporter G family member 41 isoform X2 [Arabidopsis lyrata subsp. lyrata]|uniref:ABC transporter G family member 41 isoform X2 n=1 Tax=Arabidopsis lyrata subsp. lyrata TaxID=81972 RepID=UPI000A29BF76|nr:ABC transporter G family member 41 isoform X2 [Arabidopsis lyrata subsp. lyrata]|eukprot:XP_020875007.1 ABC transporter G family member 41 isoform X2 [Arabidopsis lyrata subsp. lyrata]
MCSSRDISLCISYILKKSDFNSFFIHVKFCLLLLVVISFFGCIFLTMAQTGEDDDKAKSLQVEIRSQWATVERLPTFKRVTTALLHTRDDASDIVDVTKLEGAERRLLIEKLVKQIEVDNLRLLRNIRKRIDEVGIELPTVEVRFNDLSVEAECEVIHGKPIPTLWNTIKGILSEFICSKKETKISILKGVSGIVRPGRMTLLLGPPGCGKTTLLQALSGRLSHSVKVGGEVSYNGCLLSEFIPEKTSSYISQNDLHIPELSVRETLDFSACCQGIGSRIEIMKEISRREKLKEIVPDPDIDAYMKAISVEGLKNNMQTDYILKILGLDICADTRAGDATRPGISGGQKRRLTTGEIVVGPATTLFMDEISNGLDSSTTFQIVSCLQQLAHIAEATILISLLQPAPETFELFDDVILMGEGKIIYHAPRADIGRFFEGCGFKCPERKGVADFLQEKEELSKPFDKSQTHMDGLCFRKYSLGKWEMLKACSRREFLLMKRNSSIYLFKSGLLVFNALVTMTIFLQAGATRDARHGNYLMGSMFSALFRLLADGLPELTLTISRLGVFCKQKDLYFYPAWAYAIPSIILRIPLSVLDSFIWTSLTYYVIGYSPEVGRFFRHFIILLTFHLSCISMFRAIASICRTFVACSITGAISVLVLALFGGFIIPKSSMPTWLGWGFWLSPLSYAEIGLTANEFFAPRWRKLISGNTTAGEQVLDVRGLNFGRHSYWTAFGALIGFVLFFNVLYTLALTYRNNPQRSRAIISHGKNSQCSVEDFKPCPEITSRAKTGKVSLPFKPLTVTFQNVQYYIETPQGKTRQLLSDITGALKPGVLTSLMGVSGAGKTTLLDVLSGRKTRGIIKGEIKVGGYPKVQETFARVSAYCEQFDIHSPNITVEESLKYSAWLRLPYNIDLKTKNELVKEVLETVELENIKDSMVGLPGISGLSTEQRKRLTIAVELVANPSIIFLDEPTTGLDARAAAIVMRAVKNVAETGRTVVCTIHQPSIDIFETFDELILLKDGGHLVYYGPLGKHSSKVIEYFESVPGVPKVQKNCNPATWMLDITCKSAEDRLGMDFAQAYKDSTLYKENKMVVEQLSSASLGSKALSFPSRFSQTGWEQLKACLWKQHCSYWRNPSHNLTRIVFIMLNSLLSGLLFWQKAKDINNQQDLFSIFGSMYTLVIFSGINNCATVMNFIATERNVFYRERFARMYSSWAYSFSQVLVEVPYSLLQSLLCTIIVYPMIGYHMSVYKMFWSLYSIFCSLLIFNYCGMLMVALTPNIHMALTLRSTFFSMVNLFAGFVMPKQKIPKWWIWMYYLSPTSWALEGLLSSQYGDVEKEIIVFGEKKRVSALLEDYFGYKHDSLAVVAFVLIGFPIIVASLFAFFMSKLNFQKK